MNKVWIHIDCGFELSRRIVGLGALQLCGKKFEVDIDGFIEEEQRYFSPMAVRDQAATGALRQSWREETVRERQERISLEVFKLTEGKVTRGPFKGMTLSSQRWWGDLDLGSQCLGLYEREILQILAETAPQTSGSFIDIGAADGYYTTGVLYSRLFERAIAFEQSEIGRGEIIHGWKLNGSPGELRVENEATENSILALPRGSLENALILIDVEGAEFGLLTGRVLSEMKRATVIIEIHNWVPDFKQKYAALLRRASQIFDIERIPSLDRDTSSLPELRDFTDDNRLLLTSERRPCLMRFLKLTPRP